MILVVGACGFVGRRMVKAVAGSGETCLRASHDQGGDLIIDLSMPQERLELPNGVTHALILSSITSIDICFREPERTTSFNVDNTIDLLKLLLARDIQPVFFSSDIIFDGERGNYREDDAAMPSTAYGRQKRAVERFLEENAPDALIIRLGKLYTFDADDTSPVRGLINDLKAGKPVRAATDQMLTPTLAEEVAVGVMRLIHMGAQGVFHLAPQADGTLSRYQMATAVARSVNANPALVQACSIADFSFAEPRPRDCTLNAEKFLRVTGMRLTPFGRALDEAKEQLQRR